MPIYIINNSIICMYSFINDIKIDIHYKIFSSKFKILDNDKKHS
jgi:hypothetical protein